jgi:hypothetical protein
VLVRIIDVPPGEAPAWVRRAWVGLLLPLVPGHTGPRRMRAHGVLTGPRTWLARLWWLLSGGGWEERGYAVRARLAVTLLAEHAPEAAAWWREHAGHVLGPDQLFIFHTHVCRPEEWSPRALSLREHLEARFGPLSEAVQGRLLGLSAERLSDLDRRLLRAASLDELGLSEDGPAAGGDTPC